MSGGMCVCVCLDPGVQKKNKKNGKGSISKLWGYGGCQGHHVVIEFVGCRVHRVVVEFVVLTFVLVVR